MKKITLLLLLFVSTAFYAQSTGISYQAIIYNPNGEVIPGYNNANAPLANKNICLQFTIVDSASLTEYQEKITVTTDEYGMVNTVIGTGIQTGGYATSFANVNWSLPSKSLKVGLDTFGLCTNFLEISNQLFTSVPYAFAADSAENVTGVVPILHGGTGATTVLGAKTNLGLENVDNTRDINKPISIATQAALNLKEDLANKSTNVTTDGTSNTKYPSVKAVKDYVDAGSTAQNAALTNEANIRAAADVVLTNNLATEVTRATNAENTLTNNLAAEIANRTNADLLKEDLVNKSLNVNTDAASNTKYPSVRAIKSYVDASDSSISSDLAAERVARIAGDNTLTANIASEITRATALDNTLTNNLLQELIRATAAENTLTTNLAAEVTNRTNADLLKENLVNKSTNVTTDGTSNTKYPSVKSVKDYVDAGVATATTAVTNEATIRAAADATLTTNLAAEVTRATAAEATLTTNLAAEVTRATAAEATKEVLVNKSTSVTTDGTSDTKYPTVKSVKDYVDTNASNINAALAAEAATRAAADATLTTNLAAEVTRATAAETVLTNNLSTEAATRAAADATLTTNLAAEVTRATAAETVLTNNLSTEAATRAAADATLTTNLAAEVTRATAAETTLTNDLAAEVTRATAAEATKENLVNKSTSVTTDGTSDTKYPTVKSVKDYVDTNASNINAAIAAEAATRASADATLTTNLAAEVTRATAADATLTTNLAAEVTRATAAEATLTTNLAAEVTRATAADATLTTNLAAEVTRATAAEATLTTNLAAEVTRATAAEATLTTNLAAEVSRATAAEATKEVLVNKSTDVTTDGTSNTKYPTVKSVKDYVDTNASNNNAALAAEVTRATAAETVLTTNLAAEVTRATAAEATKEVLVNKSTSVTTDGTSDTKYPTVKSVKDYVDTNASNINAALAAEAATRAAADATLTTNLAAEVTRATATETLLTNNLSTEAATRASADATLTTNLAAEVTRATAAETVLTTNLAAEVTRATAAETVLTNNLSTEAATRASADTTLTTNLAAEVTRATAAETVLTNNLSTEAATRAAADATLTTNLAAEVTRARAAETTLTNDLAAEVTRATAAEATKEDLVNKSTSVTTDGTSDTKYPTVKSVKDYVDTSITSATPDASATVKGKVQLAGDLTGTAAAPIVANNKITTSKIVDSNVTYAKIQDVNSGKILGRTSTGAGVVEEVATTGTGSVVLSNSPTFTGAPVLPTGSTAVTQLPLDNTTAIATTEFVTTAISVATIPDATTTMKGKVQLAGDLTGTAAAPIVGNNKITTSKIVDSNVTYAKIQDINSGKILGRTSTGAGVVEEVATTGTGSVVLSNSPTFTGAPVLPTGTTAITQSIGNNSTAIATTAYVMTANATNANLTGDVTSVGNATTLSSSGVTAGTYGNNLAIPVITVDSKGRITTLTTNLLSPSLQEESVEYTNITDGQTSFTLSHTPSNSTLVRMYINGVLISQSANTRSGTTITYIPSNNGAYSLTVGDRIQLYYYF